MNSYILYVIGLQDIQSKFFVYYTQTEDFNKVMNKNLFLYLKVSNLFNFLENHCTSFLIFIVSFFDIILRLY
jgi:hypothetical protein